jgi:hypothetical protein
MTGIKKVRAIREAIEAEMSGDIREYENPTNATIPGIGQGATQQAMR